MAVTSEHQLEDILTKPLAGFLSCIDANTYLDGEVPNMSHG